MGSKEDITKYSNLHHHEREKSLKWAKTLCTPKYIQ